MTILSQADEADALTGRPIRFINTFEQCCSLMLLYQLNASLTFNGQTAVGHGRADYLSCSNKLYIVNLQSVLEAT